MFGVGIWRTLLVLLYLAVTWPLVLGSSTTPFPADIPEGVAVAALWLAVLAGLNLGWRRWRWSHARHETLKPSYRESVTAIPVVLLAFVLALLAGAGQRLNAENARQAPATGDATSSSPLDRDRGAYAAWLAQYPTAVGQMGLVIHNYRLVLREETSPKPNLSRLLADFTAAETHAKLYQSAIIALPPERPVVAEMKALHLHEAQTLVTATTDYVHGLKPYNQHLLDTGDALWARFMRQVRASSQAEDATYHRLGGYAAFKNRVDWNALASEMGSATSTGRSG